MGPMGAGGITGGYLQVQGVTGAALQVEAVLRRAPTHGGVLRHYDGGLQVGGTPVLRRGPTGSEAARLVLPFFATNCAMFTARSLRPCVPCADPE